VATSRVIGANLNHLPADSIRDMRGDHAAFLAIIRREIAPLYPPDVARLSDGELGCYCAAPFPNPNDALHQPVKIGVTLEGRDLWRWQINGTTYWLTQTVDSDHILHSFQFSLISKTPNAPLRHANLINAGNETTGVKWTPQGESKDEREWEIRF